MSIFGKWPVGFCLFTFCYASSDEGAVASKLDSILNLSRQANNNHGIISFPGKLHSNIHRTELFSAMI